MIGFLNGMTIDAHATDTAYYDASIDSDMGLSVGFSLDQAVYRSFWVGLTIDLLQVRKGFGFGDYSAKALNPALRFSLHLRAAGSRWSFRPGVACGVALLEEIYSFKSSQYLTLRPFLQAVCHVSPKTGILFELNEFQTLQGGNDDYDIEAGPTFGLRIGLLK
jgi:hypothetical protein